MRVTPTGLSEYHNGSEVLRYGQDIGSRSQFGVWYHDSIRAAQEPTWAMDCEVEDKIVVQVDTILAADATNGVYAIDRDEFRKHRAKIDGREQYVASESDDFVEKVTDEHGDVLRGNLWIESGKQVDEGYHKKANH